MTETCLPFGSSVDGRPTRQAFNFTRMVARASLIAVVLSPTRPVGLLAQGKQQSLLEEMRISGSKLGLSTIGGMAVSNRGVVAISQPSESKLLFFDSSGQSLGSFGRAGEGPGEFRGIGEFEWLGDTLYVLGVHLTFIAPDLKLLRTRSYPIPNEFPAELRTSPPMIGIASTMRLSPDGSRIILGVVRDSGRAGVPPVMRRTYLRVSSSDKVERVLIIAPPDMLPGYRGAFALQTRIALDPAGEYVAVLTTPDLIGSKRDRQWHLQVQDHQGTTVGSFDQQYSAVRTPSQLADSQKARENGRSSSAPTQVGAPPPGPRTAPGGPSVVFTPEFLPPVRRILVTTDQTVWVERWLVGTTHVWEAFDFHGQLVASLTLQESSDLMAANRNQIWVIERDVDDVPSIVRYRVVG